LLFGVELRLLPGFGDAAGQLSSGCAAFSLAASSKSTASKLDFQHFSCALPSGDNPEDILVGDES
jgi:hypothetical protein